MVITPKVRKNMTFENDAPLCHVFFPYHLEHLGAPSLDADIVPPTCHLSDPSFTFPCHEHCLKPIFRNDFG